MSRARQRESRGKGCRDGTVESAMDGNRCEDVDRCVQYMADAGPDLSSSHGHGRCPLSYRRSERVRRVAQSKGDGWRTKEDHFRACE